MVNAITIIVVVLISLAIIGMGVSEFFKSVGTGIEKVAENPQVQQQTEKIKDYAMTKGAELGKDILNQVINGVKND